MSVWGGIVEFDSGGFNGNTAFAFQVHQIQHLFSHIALCERIGMLEKSVAERAFPVVDVS